MRSGLLYHTFLRFELECFHDRAGMCRNGKLLNSKNRIVGSSCCCFEGECPLLHFQEDTQFYVGKRVAYVYKADSAV